MTDGINDDRGDFHAVYETLLSLKNEIDFIINQLSEGQFERVSTFVSNWAFLVNKYKYVEDSLTNTLVVEKLLVHDAKLCAELIAIGRTITLINNFLRCAAKDFSLDSDRIL